MKIKKASPGLDGRNRLVAVPKTHGRHDCKRTHFAGVTRELEHVSDKIERRPVISVQTRLYGGDVEQIHEASLRGKVW